MSTMRKCVGNVLGEVRGLCDVVMQYAGCIGELLQIALRNSMTSEWASHFYYCSSMGKREVIIEYTGKTEPIPTVQFLEKELMKLFGKTPRTYEHVYNPGEPEKPSKEKMTEWVQSFFSKKTDHLSFSLKDYSDPHLSHQMWLMKWVAIHCICPRDDSSMAYILQIQSKTHSEGMPTEADLVRERDRLQALNQQTPRNADCTIS